jgi:N-acetylglucosaminyl-diphospho-decaprenol L-rhamnosyltransferase
MNKSALNENLVTVSIVSHGHCEMLLDLLRQIAKKSVGVAHVILTHNIPSVLEVNSSVFPFKITIINNLKPIGFGPNHNQAFKFCDSKYFCVLNPDVEFLENPFDELIHCLLDVTVGVVAPSTVDGDGVLEDTFRFFPTPISLFRKLAFGDKGIYPLNSGNDLVRPDWVAGMFLLFRKSVYKELHGFDKSYFLYYEDIDICLRVWKLGKSVVLSRRSLIVHNARRDSHSSPRFIIMHLTSIFRFFCKHWLRFPR